MSKNLSSVGSRPLPQAGVGGRGRGAFEDLTMIIEFYGDNFGSSKKISIDISEQERGRAPQTPPLDPPLLSDEQKNYKTYCHKVHIFKD